MQLHRSIYSQLFPYHKGEESTPTGGAFPAPAAALRPIEAALEGGDEPKDMFARTGTVGGNEQPITVRPPEEGRIQEGDFVKPDAYAKEYYDNGIEKRPMDERGPDGDSIIFGRNDGERDPMNPYYNAEYDKRGDGPAAEDPIDELTQIGDAARRGVRYDEPRAIQWKHGDPTAEETVTVDEDNPVETDQGQPLAFDPRNQYEQLGKTERSPMLDARMQEVRHGQLDDFALNGGMTGGGARAPMPMGTPTTAGQPEAVMAGAKAGKKVKKTFAEQHPNFKYPYPNPQNDEEVAANATAEMREQAQNPVNKDKGWKGLIKELIENFSYGMSKTPQGASALQALLLGATGAGAGFVNKGWNEQRAAEAALPGLIDAEQAAGQRVQRQRAWDDKQQDNRLQQADFLRKRENDARNYEIKIRTLDWKKEDRDRYYELEGIKQDARERKDEKTYNLAVRRQEEIERHNLKAEGQAATKEVGRMVRAGQTQAGATTRAQIKSGDDARKMLLTIDRIAQTDGLNPAEVEERKKQFLQSLTPEVRKQLGMQNGTLTFRRRR